MSMYRRFSLLDVILVVLIAAGIFAAVFFTGGKSVSAADEKKEIYFTVELTNLKQELVDQVKVGDRILDSTRGQYYGVIEALEVKSTDRLVRDFENKRFVRTDVPDRYTLWITVRCNGTESDTEIKVEGEVFKVGKRLTIKSKGYGGIGYVVNLRADR